VPHFELRDVSKRRQGADRGFELRVEDFMLRSGERLAVVGPSGCGKTTLLGMCGLASAPTSCAVFSLHDGPMTWEVDTLWRQNRHEQLARLRARLFGFVLQTGGVLPFLTVRGNVELSQQLSGRPDHARVDLLLDRLGMKELAHEWPARLSVGQRQRVSIGRALAHRPAFVIADEPTAALDPANARGVVRLLLELTTADAAALLVVSHDRSLVEEASIPVLEIVADRVEGEMQWRSVVSRSQACQDAA
jgi:putative ABC transport system ATP-binding protein